MGEGGDESLSVRSRSTSKAIPVWVSCLGWGKHEWSTGTRPLQLLLQAFGPSYRSEFLSETSRDPDRSSLLFFFFCILGLRPGAVRP